MRNTRGRGKSDFSRQINLEARNQGIVAVALRATRALPAGKRLQPSGFMGLHTLPSGFPCLRFSGPVATDQCGFYTDREQTGKQQAEVRHLAGLGKPAELSWKLNFQIQNSSIPDFLISLSS